MKHWRVQIILLITTVFLTTSYAQTNVPLKQFWGEVQRQYEYNLMEGGLRAWLFEISKSMSGDSNTDALARLEVIDRDQELQEKILLRIYIDNDGSNERERFYLGRLCGNYKLGNLIADYACNKYSKDDRVIAIIEKNKESAHEEHMQKQENERLQKEKDVAEIKEREAIYAERKLTEEKQKADKDFVNRVTYNYESWLMQSERKAPNTFDTTMPKFSGGVKRWQKYINDSIYAVLKSKHIEYIPVCIVGFLVDVDGNVQNVKIEKSANIEADSVILKTIKNTSGYWKPAKIAVAKEKNKGLLKTNGTTHVTVDYFMHMPFQL